MTAHTRRVGIRVSDQKHQAQPHPTTLDHQAQPHPTTLDHQVGRHNGQEDPDASAPDISDARAIRLAAGNHG